MLVGVAVPSTAPLAANTVALIQGPLMNAIAEDETGLPTGMDVSVCGSAAVWTGTTAEGFVSGATCGDWTATQTKASVGNYAMKDKTWTDASTCSACTQEELPLYCVEKVVP